MKLIKPFIFSYLLALIIFAHTQAFADYLINPSTEVPFTAPDQVHLTKKDLLIVTHESTDWDPGQTTRVGIRDAVDLAKNYYHADVVYLQANGDLDSYFYSYLPTYFVQSAGGELSFSFAATHVFSAGGYFEQCQIHTASDVLSRWKAPQFKGRVLTLELPLDAIYQTGLFIKKTDPYYPKVLDFRRILNENTFPVSQLLRIINDPQQINEYLARYVDELLSMAGMKDSGRKVLVQLGRGNPKKDPFIFERDPGGAAVDPSPLIIHFDYVP